MRKISYIISFFAVVCTLLLNVLSNSRSDWLVVRTPEVLHTVITITYGLSQRCEYTLTSVPGKNNGKWEYSNFECRAFPAKVADGCEDENAGFCSAWVSASYFAELAIWCGVASSIAILFGVSTHSRRRRIWRAVAGLIFLHATFQITAFALVTDLYRTSRFPTFDQARPGMAYVLNVVSWASGMLLVLGIIITGMAADEGRRWAAGSRAYQPLNH